MKCEFAWFDRHPGWRECKSTATRFYLDKRDEVYLAYCPAHVPVNQERFEPISEEEYIAAQVMAG